ncbi:hypothetical protein JHK87_054216 [Glycine soja]|nr:hypothetical protein JHK87_054216 [Glycine soja]
MSLPFSYLGIPIGANPRRCGLWDPILRKSETKLSRWKQRYLSYGGRVTLIKATLTSIPIFYLSFFRIPNRVAEKLTQIQRRFLWGGGLDQKKIAWVKWDTIFLPKDKGGLEIKDIRIFNRALLGKWRWNLMQQHDDLWAKILHSKYGGWRALDEGTSVTNESIWWQDLRSVIHEQGVQALLQSAIEWKVGCGDEVRFWEDCWLTDQESLRAKYPRLYQISCQQQQVIQDMGGHSENDWEWKLEWRRHLFDNEVQAAVSFLEDISRGHFDTRTSDCWVWKLEPSGQYSTRSAYRMLLEGATDQTVDEALQDLWQLNIPLKATIFAWRLIKDRIPTKGNLRRRQVQLNDSLCPFCSRQEEEASHLFFNCPRVLPLWWESLSWTKTVGAFSLIPRQNYMQHTLILKGKIPQSRWKCWWVALTWSIWQHRNRIVFLNETFNGPKLMEDAIFLVWSWLRQLEKGFAQPYNFWSSNLSVTFSI